MQTFGKTIKSITKSVANTLNCVASHNELSVIGRVSFLLLNRLHRHSFTSNQVAKILSSSIVSQKLTKPAEISVAYIVKASDIQKFLTSIENLEENIKNRITEKILVSDKVGINYVKDNLYGWTILDESELIEPKILATIKTFPIQRQGWVMQQVLKFKAVELAKNPATLIIDADTVLSSPRAWLDSNNRQILLVSDEYHEPYRNHYSSYFSQKPLRVSFVTHHQLMQKEIIKQMFGRKLERINDWLMFGDSELDSPISEYNTYGNYLFLNFPKRTKIAKWGNLPGTFDGKKIVIKKQFKRFKNYSISVHHYQNPNPVAPK